MGQLLSKSMDSTGLGEIDCSIVEVTIVNKTLLDTVTHVSSMLREANFRNFRLMVSMILRDCI